MMRVTERKPSTAGKKRTPSQVFHLISRYLGEVGKHFAEKKRCEGFWFFFTIFFRLPHPHPPVGGCVGGWCATVMMKILITGGGFTFFFTPCQQKKGRQRVFHLQSSDLRPFTWRQRFPWGGKWGNLCAI